MNGRQPSMILDNQEKNEKIGFLNRDNNTRKSKKIFYNEEFDPGSG